MGKLKAIIPIFFALSIAAGGSMFLYRWLQVKPEKVVTVEVEAVPVVVAAVDLKWGTKLSKEMLKTVPFLKESLPPGFSSDMVALENRVSIIPLKTNEPVIESKLAPENVTTGGVAAILQPGKRAIAVKGDKVIGISGFIQPGNKVDVLVTLKDPKIQKEVTKLVLENILILATGTEIQKNGDAKPSPVDVYTLEVTPEEGEKLSLAASEGKLQFALRNMTDIESILTTGATITQTLDSLRKAPPPPAPLKPTEPGKKAVYKQTHTVEEIKGATVSKKNFN